MQRRQPHAVEPAVALLLGVLPLQLRQSAMCTPNSRAVFRAGRGTRAPGPTCMRGQ